MLVTRPTEPDPVQLAYLVSEVPLSPNTPREIHALWLVLRAIEKAKDDTFEVIGARVLPGSEKSDLDRLLLIGEDLRLLQSDRYRGVLSPDGHAFAIAKHWRLWEPSVECRKLLRVRDLEHILIDPSEFARRPVVIDLFAGVGGLSLGFTAAGFNVALAVDNDRQACDAHKLNFPDTRVIESDVSSFADNPAGFLKQYPELVNQRIAGVIGGPPCQGFSVAGERSARDERNLLTTKFIEAVLLIEPDFFVMENVPGLMTDGARPQFNNYLSRLSSAKGGPASEISDALPQLPKKRPRNYRKKIVSELIRKFQAIADEYFRQHVIAPSQPQETFSDLYHALEELAAVEFATAFPDPKYGVLHLVNEIQEKLAVIAIASVFRRLSKSDRTIQRDLKGRFQTISTLFAEGKLLGEAFKKIGNDYDAIPITKNYKGKLIGPLLDRLIQNANRLYDVAAPQILNAGSFGTPQDRTRLFLVGIKKSLYKPFSFPEPTHSFKSSKILNGSIEYLSPTSQQALGDLPDIDMIPNLIGEDTFSVKKLALSPSNYASLMRLDTLAEKEYSLPRITWNPYVVDCSKRTTHKVDVVVRLEKLDHGERDKVSRKARLHPDMPSHTLRAGTKESKGSHTAVRPIHYKYNRVISVREGARLMGYSDWMTFHATKWHGFRLVGNGVPLQLGQAIARQLLDHLYRVG